LTSGARAVEVVLALGAGGRGEAVVAHAAAVVLHHAIGVAIGVGILAGIARVAAVASAHAIGITIAPVRTRAPGRTIALGTGTRAYLSAILSKAAELARCTGVVGARARTRRPANARQSAVLGPSSVVVVAALLGQRAPAARARQRLRVTALARTRATRHGVIGTIA